MPLDHDFWNDGLYFQSTGPWAIEPNVRAGIHCVLILSRVQEEYQLIAQELARAVGWGFAHYKRFSVSIEYISQRITRLGSENNNKTVEDVEVDHIDQLNLGSLEMTTPQAHFVKILAQLPTSSRISQHIRCIRPPGSDLVCHASPHRHNERHYDA
ncbi:hypothetical protein PCASD_17133 [Puccinia coronata f. sp. avenae]|uniref:Uncharacterized protein n=1 Tax=Puccinia coronata f. sp. avenae TaxID=200324 RepID=A0A2N5SXD3_9BASI|nr:hypothetical protein PCASD_17133 [Puccinia coronata f. sp. avenae]